MPKTLRRTKPTLPNWFLESSSPAAPKKVPEKPTPAPASTSGDRDEVEVLVADVDRTQRRWWFRVLPALPDSLRLAWGVRANELQDAGVGFPEHEERAFNEITAQCVTGS